MNVTLYQILFEVEMSICDRFPSLSPFDIRQKRFHEVFLLIRRLNVYNEQEKKPKKIRRQASDTWF